VFTSIVGVQDLEVFTSIVGVQDLDALRELMRGQILVQDLGVDAFFLDRG